MMVITIIVMLILAGVSISMVVGENGVLTRASSSSIKTKLSTVVEDFNLAVSDVEMQYQEAVAIKSSIASKKNVYFTVERINESLSQSKILTTNISSNFIPPIDVGNNETGTPLTTLISYKLANKIKVYSKSNNKADFTNCGYEVFVMYLSNGISSTELGSDIFATICYINDGIPHLVDLGLVQSNITESTVNSTTPLRNGILHYNEKFNELESSLDSAGGTLPTSVTWLYNSERGLENK